MAPDAQVGIAQVEIVQVALADNVQVDLVQVAQVEIVQVALADNVQVDQAEIVQVALVDLVQQEPVVDLPVPAHQVAHQVADQVADQIQLEVVVTQPVHLENLVAGLQRVVSQSAQSVKSSTT